jgi:hypothetical protein
MIGATGFLVDAHCAKGPNHRESCNLVDHYDWELRGFNKLADWARPWLELWGTDARVSDFNESWPNPLIVCERLQATGPHSLRMGFVHGDLHPRNIVFAEDDTVRVIDFGWARPLPPDKPGMSLELHHRAQHIVKDFVLLEANLRFVTLPPFLPYEDVMAVADWIDVEAALPSVGHAECALRIGLMEQLRERVAAHIGGNCEDWDIEYVVPLFLVSLGLLRYSCDADCPWAARYTVLRLARYLVDERNVITM